jgi:hypothetical protein
MRRLSVLALAIQAACASAPLVDAQSKPRERISSGTSTPAPAAPTAPNSIGAPRTTSNAANVPARSHLPPRAIVLYSEQANWFGFIPPGGPGCALPCTLFLPRTPGAVLHLTRYGADGPDYELDVDDLDEPDAPQPYTGITISRRKSYTAMGGLIAGGALAALAGATVFGVGAQKDCRSGACALGGTLLGIGATLVVLGVIVGPREQTVLSVAGSDR